jgi:formylglycine-generating enzyme required for sulfatase activity
MMRSNNSRFSERDGTVLDNETGLEWEANFHQMTWDEAQEYAESLRLGDHDDWRVPTRLELESLLNLEKANPASDFPGMTMTSGWFWSSSSYVHSPGRAWLVAFGYGGVNPGVKDFGYFYVRCVRRRYRTCFTEGDE